MWANYSLAGSAAGSVAGWAAGPLLSATWVGAAAAAGAGAGAAEVDGAAVVVSRCFSIHAMIVSASFSFTPSGSFWSS